MTLTIWSDISEAVIQPGETHTFELNVRGNAARPVPGARLKIALQGEADGIKSPASVRSDAQGKARFTVKTGPRPVRCEVKVQARGGSWTGTICATSVRVALKENLILSQTEEVLLKLLFWDKKRVLVLREFGGGLGGGRVLQVQASDARGVNVTQVAKIGPRAIAWDEAERYKLVGPYVPSAAQVCGFAGYGLHGVVLYSDANANRFLEKVQPLGDFFVQREIEDVHQALFSILERGMRLLYRQFAVRPGTYRDLVGKFMPEHLVVTLGGAKHPCGIRFGKTAGAASFKGKRCSPRDLQQGAVSFKAGDLVALEGFRIGKVQEGDLNLEDAEQRDYKVKVRFDGKPPAGLIAGEVVTVVARVVTDRKSRIQWAVQDCLKRHGAAACQFGYEIGGEMYPNPTELLDRTLDESSLYAISTIHGDLHWDNVMIESPTNWRLIDYGLTGAGPVLFDFIKLELYLRVKVLANLDELSPKQVLDFECDLMANPIGRLDGKEFDEPLLNKAAFAIRAIRRLAEPYLPDGFADYWKLLFCYGLALAKYYPTADRWKAADGKTQAGCQKSGRQFFHALATALAVGRVLNWDIATQSRPKLKCRFVGMGSRLEPEPGVVALDVGNMCGPGVIDHHFAGSGFRCAASAVLARPEFVTQHLKGIPFSDVTWVLHQEPDFDAITSCYLAWHRLNLGYFPPGAAELARYGEMVDAGGDFLERVPFPERTPYALFSLAINESERFRLKKSELESTHRFKLQRGFEILDYLCRLELQGIHAFHTNSVPHEHGFWECIMRRDKEVFEIRDLGRAIVFRGAVRDDNQRKELDGVILDSPISVFFKVWVRKGPSPLLVVQTRPPDRPDKRIVISVPPAMEQALKGLGMALEIAETKARKELAKVRPPPPRWQGVDNADPWYDGRGHNHTIVDAPRVGTVLTVEEVKNILVAGDWIK